MLDGVLKFVRSVEEKYITLPFFCSKAIASVARSQNIFMILLISGITLWNTLEYAIINTQIK